MKSTYIPNFLAVILFFITLIISACKKDPDDEFVPEEKEYVLRIPKGFPIPVIPQDNQLKDDRISLGKMLFFDPILSKDSSVSCGSCHHQEYAFSDPKAVSAGVNGASGTRNSMPLVNMAWSTSFFWDGGVPSLELQVLAPITNHLEMNLSLSEAIQRLREHPQYPSLFRKAYSREPDEYALFRAIACFERTLISGDSPFDQYFYQGNASALNISREKGLDLFFGNKLHCASCHTGVNFTNGTFQNNGLYANYLDQGRYLISNDPADKGKFKVPTLRNVALTAPYMHDGSIASLEGVVEHYASGGKEHPNKSPHVHKDLMPLTAQEKTDLINFLKSLSDTTFTSNKKYRP